MAGLLHLTVAELAPHPLQLHRLFQGKQGVAATLTVSLSLGFHPHVFLESSINSQVVAVMERARALVVAAYLAQIRGGSS